MPPNQTIPSASETFVVSAWLAQGTEKIAFRQSIKSKDARN
jgi:hypothetical protein